MDQVLTVPFAAMQYRYGVIACFSSTESTGMREMQGERLGNESRDKRCQTRRTGPIIDVETRTVASSSCGNNRRSQASEFCVRRRIGDDVGCRLCAWDVSFQRLGVDLFPGGPSAVSVAMSRPGASPDRCPRRVEPMEQASSGVSGHREIAAASRGE